jgi:ABC-type tungstate transport system permease subunit
MPVAGAVHSINSRPHMHEGAGMKQEPDALKKIAEARAPFASRADDSGIHKAELTVRMDGL